MKTKINLLIAIALMILFMSSANSDPRRVLIEFSTGTWCGYCPCGDSIILHNILPQHPQTIVLAYHGSGSDPFINFNGNNIISLLGITAYPLALFDRAKGAPLDFDYNWPDSVNSRYSQVPNSVINLVVTSKTYNTSTRELSATVNATALQNLTGQYKINFVITEDNIVYQQNFYALCGTPGYHNDFIHYWVVRNMVNGATGENVNTGTWNQNQTITKTITTIDSAGWVAGNCNLNVFIYKDGSTLNTSAIDQSTKQSVTNPLGVSTPSGIPDKFILEQNYPNPFNPVTNIKFSIPEEGYTTLKIYDITGRVAAIMIDGYMKAGNYNAEFEGNNYSSGIYFYTLTTKSNSETKKMLLVK